jgi:hypothetical protein
MPQDTLRLLHLNTSAPPPGLSKLWLLSSVIHHEIWTSFKSIIEILTIKLKKNYRKIKLLQTESVYTIFLVNIQR